MPLMVMSLILNRFENSRMPFFAKPIAKSIAGKVRASYLSPNITRNLRYLEETLAVHPWFAGDTFTAADIQMSFPVEAASARAGLTANYPKLQRPYDLLT